jgi:hypothetical protein
VPTYVPHWRLTLSGTLGTGTPAPEIWSLGMSIGASAGPLGGVPSQDVFDAMCAAVTPLITAGGMGIANTVRLTSVQVAAINASGHFATGADGAYQRLIKDYSGQQLVGNAAHSTEPPQAALVVSLNTSRVGRVGKGRFYLPMPCFPTAAADLLISAAAATSVRDVVKERLTALNAAMANGTPPQGPRVCVASGGSLKNGTPPGNYPVTSVRIGRAIDTVRSRRNALQESYTASAAL